MTRITFFLLLLFQLSFSQNSTITISFDKAKDSTKVFFGSSFDGDPSHFVYNNDFCYITNHSFKKVFNQKGAGIIQLIQNDCIPFSITVPNSEGDTVKISIKTINDKPTVFFEGSNAAGLELLNNSPDFYRLYKSVGLVLANSYTSKEILDNLETILQGNSKQLDLLLRENKISKTFHNLSKRYLETEVIGFCYSNLSLFLGQKKDVSNKIKLSIDEINKTIKSLDQKYNVFDEKYSAIKTITQYYNIRSKCAFIESGILNGKENNYGLWEKNELRKFNFAPKALQEFLIYNEINRDGFNLDLFTAYKNTIPNGIYLSLLRKGFEALKLKKETSVISLASFDEETKELQSIDTKEYTNLNDLIAQNFKGKAVFIDIWATWCSPCKVEFKHSEGLASFIKSKNIVVLYITIDKASAIEKWKNSIKEFGLYGFHYFSAPAFKNNLEAVLHETSLGIPRYLLYNSKGELVLKNAKRPSEGQLLYDEITNAL